MQVSRPLPPPLTNTAATTFHYVVYGIVVQTMTAAPWWLLLQVDRHGHFVMTTMMNTARDGNDDIGADSDDGITNPNMEGSKHWTSTMYGCYSNSAD